MKEQKNVNVLKKLARVSSEIGSVVKNAFVDAGRGGKYKVVEWHDVVSAVKTALDNNNLIILSIPRMNKNMSGFYKTSVFKGNGYTKEVLVWDFNVQHIAIDGDTGETYNFPGIFPAYAQSSDAKGFGIASSYELKYFYIRQFNIPIIDELDVDTVDKKVTTSRTRTRTRTRTVEPKTYKKSPAPRAKIRAVEPKIEKVKVTKTKPTNNTKIANNNINRRITNNERKDWFSSAKSIGVNNENYAEFLTLTKPSKENGERISTNELTNGQYLEDVAFFETHKEGDYAKVYSTLSLCHEDLKLTKYEDKMKFLFIKSWVEIPEKYETLNKLINDTISNGKKKESK